jgi:hypothetical protein
MLPSEYIPSGLTVYLVVTWLLKAAQSGKAKSEGGALIFSCILPMKVVLIVGGAGFLFGSFYTAFVLKDIWFSVLYAALSLAATVAYPSEIVIDNLKLQINRWYASPRNIPWKDVERIEYHRGPVTTVVIGKSGAKIAHTGMHSDPSTFRSECERRTGLKIQTKQF